MKLGVFLLFTPLATGLASGADLETLAKFGLLGIVLGWFMLKADRRLGNIEHSMNGVRRAMLIEVMERDSASDTTRRICHDELRKFDPELADSYRGSKR